MEKKYREVNESDIGETVEISYAEFIHETKSWISACLHKILTKDERGQSFLVTVNGSWALARHARAELPLSYLNLHQASGLKVGDWVKITRKAESNEQGWGAIWNDAMDHYVGCVARISIDLGASYGFKISGTGGWSYPCFVLEKVTSRPATEADVGQQVIWQSSGSSLRTYILESVFTLHNQSDAPPRAVLQPAGGLGELKFAFLRDLTVDLQPAPEQKETQTNG